MSERVPYVFRGRLGIANIALAVVNTVLFGIILKTTGRVPDYKSAFGNAVGLPVPLAMIGWMLGSGIAVFVKRQLPYGQRAGMISAVAILVIQALFTLFCLFSLIAGS
jgi:hypothetical protein